ncbi:hypothetical protein EDD86DRAFT_209585, partial [Gorgonomyces haynaldii]
MSEPKKKMIFRAGEAIPYKPLADPSLEEYFSRPNVRKHLMNNGWFAEYAECAECGLTDRGPIKMCSQCAHFYHVACLPTYPLSKHKRNVCILYYVTKHVDIEMLKNLLLETGHFNKVDLINVDTLHKEKKLHSEILSQYDACLVTAFMGGRHEKEGWPEQDALGDLLAEQVLKTEETKRKHCGIVVGPLTHWQVIGGNWRKHKLSPLLPGRLKTTPHLVMGKTSGPTHAVFENVNSFAGSDQSYHVSAALNEAGARTLVKWSDGFPLVAVLDDHPHVDRGKVISINFMPIPQANLRDKSGEKKTVSFWDMSSDGIHLLANCLRFVAQPTYQDSDLDLICHSCSRPKAKGKSKHNGELIRGQPYKDSILADEQELALFQEKVKALKNTGDTITLWKERFRIKFREQIMFSESKKLTIQSRLNIPRSSMAPKPTFRDIDAEKKRKEERIENAAIKIQSMFRGHLTRKTINGKEPSIPGIPKNYSLHAINDDRPSVKRDSERSESDMKQLQKKPSNVQEVQVEEANSQVDVGGHRVQSAAAPDGQELPPIEKKQRPKRGEHEAERKRILDEAKRTHQRELVDRKPKSSEKTKLLPLNTPKGQSNKRPVTRGDNRPTTRAEKRPVTRADKRPVTRQEKKLPELDTSNKDEIKPLDGCEPAPPITPNLVIESRSHSMQSIASSPDYSLNVLNFGSQSKISLESPAQPIPRRGSFDSRKQEETKRDSKTLRNSESIALAGSAYVRRVSVDHMQETPIVLRSDIGASQPKIQWY